MSDAAYANEAAVFERGERALHRGRREACCGGDLREAELRGGFVRDRFECAPLRAGEIGPYQHVMRIVIADDPIEHGADRDDGQRRCAAELEVIPAAAAEPLDIARHILGQIEYLLNGGVFGLVRRLERPLMPSRDG